MRLYVLRHGKAAARAGWIGGDDDRPLTPEGEAAMLREARALKELGVTVERIVTSPLARARRTAEIVAAELGLGETLAEDAALAHGFDVRRLAKLIAAHAPVESLMVVGHEPDLSATVGELIGGGAVALKKGGLARVDLDAPRPGGGELVWLLTPPLLGSG